MNCVQQLANFGCYVDCPTNKLNQANIYKDDENTKPRKNTKHSFCQAAELDFTHTSTNIVQH